MTGPVEDIGNWGFGIGEGKGKGGGGGGKGRGGEREGGVGGREGGEGGGRGGGREGGGKGGKGGGGGEWREGRGYYIGAILDAAYIAGVTLRAQSERSLCTELAVLKKMRLRAPCHTFTPETLTDQIQINIVKKCHV